MTYFKNTLQYVRKYFKTREDELNESERYEDILTLRHHVKQLNSNLFGGQPLPLSVVPPLVHIQVELEPFLTVDYLTTPPVNTSILFQPRPIALYVVCMLSGVRVHKPSHEQKNNQSIPTGMGTCPYETHRNASIPPARGNDTPHNRQC